MSKFQRMLDLIDAAAGLDPDKPPMENPAAATEEKRQQIDREINEKAKQLISLYDKKRSAQSFLPQHNSMVALFSSADSPTIYVQRLGVNETDGKHLAVLFGTSKRLEFVPGSKGHKIRAKKGKYDIYPPDGAGVEQPA